MTTAKAINLIEETIGREAFESLCDWAGGIELYIPSANTGDQAQAMNQRIGQAATDKLIAWAGGTRMYIPMLFQVDLMRRRQEVQALRAERKTINQIAREYKYQGRYSARHVQRLLTMQDAEILTLPDDCAQLSML